MTTKINPPSLKSKQYELYKQELLAWKEVTDLEKKKMGVAIALSLPEDDPHKIREKVFQQINLDDLKTDDGLQTLINFLDKHLAKDDLTDSLEKFEEFEDYKRQEGQSIIEYVSTFDANYRKIEKKNMTLPSEILAFKLLRKANITKEEKLLVLTGMDYQNKAELYEEAKRSLKKFKGEVIKGESSSGASIKLEPAFLAENEEALLAAGYVKSRKSYPYQNATNRRGRGSYNSNRGGYGRGGGQVEKTHTVTKKMNATGADGRVLTCKSCGSFRHLLPECPDSWENMAKVNLTEDENIVLFTGYKKYDIEQLGVDARKCAVLDSACSSTVCGRNWFEGYISSLEEADRQKVELRKGHKVFKFGGGERLKSEGEYHFPAVIAGKDVKIRSDVVSSDIPLLLSRSAMKSTGMKLDLENDTATVFGKEMSLNLTSSGHYCIPIDRHETVTVESVCAVKLDEMSKEKLHTTLLKLHRQFAHPPKKRLVSLLQDAGVWNEEYSDTLTNIQDKCQLCKVYSKTPPRPSVAMPMANVFNEKVAMDLKKWNDSWILHIIDMWSRYTISVFIQRKRPSDVINALMTHWIGIYGVMGSIMTDNGGEFNSDEMREITSILNIKVCTTAGQSPFQNGLCERVHAVTDMMLLKLQAEHKNIDSQTLLCWANMARNSLQMYNGYSSHQLVFGQSPNLPNIMKDTPPAMHATTSSEKFADHLNALHATRKSYIELEANERLRRALRTKVRAAEQVFENGELVYYKREGKDRWLGPGRVVFQDGKVIFIRHGGVFVRVSPNRLIKVGETSFEEAANNHDDDKADTDNNSVEENQENIQDNVQPTVCTISEKFPKLQTESDLPSDDIPNHLKINDKIKYKVNEQWVSAKILGRAGKSSGKYNKWYNVEDENNESQKSIDLSSTEWKKITVENNIDQEQNNTTEDEEVNFNSMEKLSDEELIQIDEAKQQELEKLCQFNTYQEVQNTGQRTLSTRWVITRKDDKFKARLVVRGFEEKYFLPSDSPTISKGSMRIFLLISSLKNWPVKTTDIKSAFLQGKELERDVYLKPPPEYGMETNHIWKLNHGLYGLKDGARQFYISVKEELLKLGFNQCELDPAMFYVSQNSSLSGIICCHVDDFLHAGNNLFDQLMCQLRRRFSAGKIEEKCFKYIGFWLSQNDSNIIMDHSEYVKNLPVITIDPKRALDKSQTLSCEEQTLFRKLVGKINWAVQGSRPDMAFEMIALSTKLQKGTVGDLVRATKQINRLKDIKSFVKFPSLSKDLNELRLVLFTDASLGNLNDGTGSTGAYILWLVDSSEKCCPIVWHAGKIKRVVRSTIAAEALSLQEGLESSYYHRKILENLMGFPPNSIKITAFVDNKSIVESIFSTKLVDDKRLRIDIAAIRESLEMNEVSDIIWCKGENQLANCMTKQGACGYKLINIIQNGLMTEDLFE